MTKRQANILKKIDRMLSEITTTRKKLDKLEVDFQRYLKKIERVLCPITTKAKRKSNG